MTMRRWLPALLAVAGVFGLSGTAFAQRGGCGGGMTNQLRGMPGGGTAQLTALRTQQAYVNQLRAAQLQQLQFQLQAQQANQQAGLLYAQMVAAEQQAFNEAMAAKARRQAKIQAAQLKAAGGGGN